MKNNYIILIIIIIIIIIIYLFNNKNELFTNSITTKHINNVCIVVFTKDEYDLIEDFINYHAYLFGINNIYIIDNNSTHPDVLEIYKKFQEKGGNLSYSSDFYNQAIETTNIMNLHKDKYDYLIGLDTDEFIGLKHNTNFLNIEEFENYFNNLPKHIEKFQVSFYSSIVDNKNKNYIDNKITFPAKYINYFTDNNNHNSIGKFFYKSDSFISTTIGSHRGNTTNNTETMSDIIYFHYHDSGARRFYERAYNIIVAYNYINNNDSLKDKILKLKPIAISVSVGAHRADTVLLKLLKEYLIVQYIKYLNRLPEINDINNMNVNINLDDIDKQFINLPIINENTDNFNYNNLLFYDNDLNENENYIYDDRISKALLQIDKII
jgi:hypothetical protein